MEPTFDASAVREDLDAIWGALLDAGAEPFRTSDRATVTQLYQRTRAGIVAPMTLREVWLAIAPVLGALNDGHVGLGFPEPLAAAPRLFPLAFALSDGEELVVVRDRTNTVAIGSRVIVVNGIAAQRFTSICLASLGGQTRLLNRTRVTMGGAWPAVALFGTGPYSVRWITPQGVSEEAEIAPTPARPHASPPAPYTYSTLRSGTVGYIDYRSCEDLPRFTAFLRDTFATIAQQRVRGLVIDIRKNGGGNSDLNDLLWTYVTTKPFKQFGGVIEKACDRLKREYGREKYVSIYGNEAWNAPNGTILRFGMNPSADLIYPKGLPDRYDGPVYLLISPQTFSSAMSCALAAKDYGLATIAGEETGEPVNSTGEVYTAVTANIGLRAFLTTKVFLAPKPHPNDEGVVPDVAVPTTPAQIAAGIDPVIDRVLALIPG